MSISSNSLGTGYIHFYVSDPMRLSDLAVPKLMEREKNSTLNEFIDESETLNEISFGQINRSVSLNSTCNLQNSDSAAYARIHELIAGMQELLEQEEFHLNRQVGEKSITVLKILEDVIRIKPPRVINEGGEELAFTWMFGNHKFFLEISVDQIDLIVLNTDTYKGSTKVVSEGTNVNSLDLVNYFDRSRKSGKPSEFISFLNYALKSRSSNAITSYESDQMIPQFN